MLKNILRVVFVASLFQTIIPGYTPSYAADHEAPYVVTLFVQTQTGQHHQFDVDLNQNWASVERQVREALGDGKLILHPSRSRGQVVDAGKKLVDLGIEPYETLYFNQTPKH